MPSPQQDAALHRTVNARLQKQREIAAFAELLAEGFSTRRACEIMSCKPSWGTNTLAIIRRQLGWQAQ